MSPGGSAPEHAPGPEPCTRRAEASRPALAIVVLAAGAGERFGGDVPKPLAVLGGRPLVAHAVDAALASRLGPVVVVVGREADAVARVLPEEVEIVVNPRWSAGIATSLQAALRSLGPRGLGAVAVGLGDQPCVGPEAYRRLSAAYDDGAALAVATYGGVRGNPVLVAAELWAEALTLDGDEGARALMRRHPVVEVPCDGTGEPTDVDTPEDLAALEARWRSETTSA